MTEDEMVGWHHQLNGHEFEQSPGDGEGQGSLACCSPQGHEESDMALVTEQQQKRNSSQQSKLVILPINKLATYLKIFL